METPQNLQKLINTIIADSKAERALEMCIGDDAEKMAAGIEHNIEITTGNSTFTQRYPLALLWLSERTDNVAATIAQLRDLSADMVIILDIAKVQTEQEYRGLGFRHLNADTGSVEIYSYDSFNYKHTPDWLNAKYWANPQMWDKYRW